MKKSKQPENFIHTPSTLGSKKELNQFIHKNLRYPKAAIENKIEGDVILNCDIDQSGKVIKVKVKKGLGYGCDEEAIRLAKLIRFEKTRHRGMHVVFHKTLKIPFRLSLVPKKQTYIYSVTTGTTKNTSVTYTIRYSNTP